MRATPPPRPPPSAPDPPPVLGRALRYRLGAAGGARRRPTGRRCNEERMRPRIRGACVLWGRGLPSAHARARVWGVTSAPARPAGGLQS